MLMVWNLDQGSYVGCTYDWHNLRSGRKLILCIPPPIVCVYLIVDLTALRVWKAHGFQMGVFQQRKMCWDELYTFEHIHVVVCSKDMRVILNQIIISQTKIEFREKLSLAFADWKEIGFEVVQSMPETLIHPCCVCRLQG
jgi:hypothetical protein